MANYLIQDATLAGIADAIRAKTGGTDTIAVTDMAGAIEDISSMPTAYTANRSGAVYFENHAIPDRETPNTYAHSDLYRDAIYMKTLYVGVNVIIGSNGFNGCTALEEAVIAGTTGNEMFWNSRALKKCTFAETADIGGNYTFDNCTALETVIIRGDRVLELGYGNIFVGCSQYLNDGGTGRIYVPASQLEAYKAATNWTKFADKFLAIEDHPDITGG